MFDKIKRYCLALCIRCPRKAKAKGDILRYALKHYLKYGKYGLCYEIRKAFNHYEIAYDVSIQCHGLLRIYFPLFKKDIAIRLFNGSNDLYWWPIKDWRSRYKFMKWLIKEYDNVEL